MSQRLETKPTEQRLTSRWETLAPRLLILALSAIAFAIRFRGLGAKSLWLDEALSWNHARIPFLEILPTLIAQDIHPPLHYFILHFWMMVAGPSETSLRFPALVAGTLLVPATYSLALALTGTKGQETDRKTASVTALLAATLVCLSPFLVYYSQEARMYSELALWGLIASYLLWRGKLLPYAIVTALALYTHYLAALTIAFQVAYVVLTSLHRPREILRYFLSLLLVALLYLPWIYGLLAQAIRLQTSPDFWKGELSLTFLLEKIFTAFALGKSGIPTQSIPIIALALVIFLAGLVFLLRRGIKGRREDLYTILYLVIPLLALYAISARNPKFSERYLIVIAPIFYIVAARGIILLSDIPESLGRLFARRQVPSLALVGRVLAAALFLGVVFVSGRELQRVDSGPGYEKDDNRAAIAYIQAHEKPGDTIILMMNIDHVFKYYYHGSLPWQGLHPADDTLYAAKKLNEYLAGKSRLWLLLWQEDWADPTGYTRDLIDANLTRQSLPESYYNLKLQLYTIDRPVAFSESLAPKRAASVNYDNSLQLLGFDPPEGAVTSGKSADLTLFWQSLHPIDSDLVVSARLRADGIDWARIDRRPAADTYPTSYWKPSRTVSGKLTLPIPPGTPPGVYDLDLLVYSREPRRDLNVIGPDGRPTAPRATVGKITVARPESQSERQAQLGSIQPESPLSATFGGEMALLGSSNLPESLRPGARLDLALYWRALRNAPTDALIGLSLTDSAGMMHPLSNARPVGGRYQTNRLLADELLTDRLILVVPVTAASGEATLSVELSSPTGNPLYDGQSQIIGKVRLGERPRVGEKPTGIQNPFEARFEDVGALIGYDISGDRLKPGGELRLTLYWKAEAGASARTKSYKVFTHLLDSASIVQAGQDAEPGGGQNPTTGWIEGEYVRDEYRLALKPDAAPGDYELEVGMYDAQTNERLKITLPDGKDSGDRIVLRKIAVEK